MQLFRLQGVEDGPNGPRFLPDLPRPPRRSAAGEEGNPATTGSENDGEGPPSHIEGRPKLAGAGDPSAPAGVGEQSWPAARGKPADALGATSSAGSEVIDLVDPDTDADTRGSATAKRQRAATLAEKPAGRGGPTDDGAAESLAKKRRLPVSKTPGNPIA